MANNPHAETYQGKTQFSGPIKAGTRWEDWPTYSRLDFTQSVTDFPNAGYVVCSQSAAVDQQNANTTASDIVLPAGSMIISMQVICTVVFDVGSGTQDVLRVVTKPQAGGTAYSQLNDSTTSTMQMSAVGVYNYGPGPFAYQTLAWKNINNSSYYEASGGGDVDIRYDSDVGGDGRAILTISYIPGLNL